MAARNENGFRNTKSKSGAFSGRLDAKTNARFTTSCAKNAGEPPEIWTRTE